MEGSQDMRDDIKGDREKLSKKPQDKAKVAAHICFSIARNFYVFYKTARQVTRAVIVIMGLSALYSLMPEAMDGISECDIAFVAENRGQILVLAMDLAIIMAIIITFSFTMFRKMEGFHSPEWIRELADLLMALAAGIYVAVCYKLGEQIFEIWLRCEGIVVGFVLLEWILGYSWEGGRKHFRSGKKRSAENYRVWCKTYRRWEWTWIGLNGCLMTLYGGCACAVDEDTHILQRSTGRYDMSGLEVYEGDIIESHLGGKALDINMVVKYGTYQAYCPNDQGYMDSVGFYVAAESLPDMPVGPLEDYALVIGNICENPELLKE